MRQADQPTNTHQMPNNGTTDQHETANNLKEPNDNGKSNYNDRNASLRDPSSLRLASLVVAPAAEGGLDGARCWLGKRKAAASPKTPRTSGGSTLDLA